MDWDRIGLNFGITYSTVNQREMNGFQWNLEKEAEEWVV